MVVVTSFWEDISHRLDTVNIILYITHRLVVPHYLLDVVSQWISFWVTVNVAGFGTGDVILGINQILQYLLKC